METPFSITNLSDPPLSIRAVSVLATIAAMAAWDLRRARRRGEHGGRYQSRRLVYRGVLACGIAGALFGVLMDQVTVSLSPEYFRIMKEIDASTMGGLRAGAADLGFAAGLVPGLIAGVCLTAAATLGRDTPGVRIGGVLRMLGVPLVMFLVAAPVMYHLQASLDVSGYQRGGLVGFDDDVVRRMVGVMGVHQAAYLSGFAGTVAATVWLRTRVSRH
ncbi:hypothetical protein [Crateriforma conspicua]|uniref:Uncharacterized protein n=1 Tax=Crateriforma conspicua TaxID=2527996 RepID=A0A5C6FJ23_9PLAN|nr:hypothetical protein [Crateriforma conspicua]TWU59684.1 hypothetical protein V7x_54580 [Crateriforma conspicua]